MKYPKFQPRVFLFACSLALATFPVAAIDFTWEGENYRNVKVVAASGDQATLESSKGEKIDVPFNSLFGLLLKDAKAMAESQGKAEAETAQSAQDEGDAEFLNRPKPKLGRRGPYVPPQDRMERAWIHGSAQAGTDEGFVVYSSSNSLPRAEPRRDGTVPEAKTSKGGAEIYEGHVFIKGSRGPGENTRYDRVLWRDGFVQLGARRFPAFSSTKPRVVVPKLSIDREWTRGADKQTMQATLIGLEEDKGLFISTKGKEFPLELSVLIEADQKFVKDAVAKHHEELEQFERDHPWVRIE